jgi:hypothetical protein
MSFAIYPSSVRRLTSGAAIRPGFTGILSPAGAAREQRIEAATSKLAFSLGSVEAQKSMWFGYLV